MRRPVLYLLVFTGGMTTMATEMSGSRLLAPYFGNSLFIWANLIGLILIYLTAGYWLGGRLADRHPEPHLLCWLTLAAAGCVAALPFVARPVMRLAIRGIEQVSAGAFLGSFTATVLLFAVPVTLLGMVTPFAIRLRITGVEQAGNVSGGLYALSTVGSIVGTFLPVLLLIPWIGTRDTMLLFAAALAAVSALGLRKALWAGAPLVILLGLTVPHGVIKPDPEAIYETESPYQYIQVVQKSDTRYLRLNEGWAVHSSYNPDQILTGAYWDYFAAAPWLGAGQAPGQVLIIGSAAGTVARQFNYYYPDTHMDGVELDPAVVDTGRRFFDMNEPNLDVHVADGRPFLEVSDQIWDFVAIDAYRQPYIPFYLTTREFFTLVSEHLSENGAVMINVAHTPTGDKLSDAIGATMRAVFPSVWSFDSGSFNRLLVATKQSSRREDVDGRMPSMPTDVRTLARQVASRMSAVEPGGLVLTDDRAPVEWLMDQMIIDYAIQE